ESLGTRHAGRVVGVDGSVGIQGEKDCARESMPLAEDLRQHRQPFFRAVLLVARQKDDVLALPRRGLSWVSNPVVRARGQWEETAQKRRYVERQFHHASPLNLAE